MPSIFELRENSKDIHQVRGLVKPHSFSLSSFEQKVLDSIKTQSIDHSHYKGLVGELLAHEYLEETFNNHISNEIISHMFITGKSGYIIGNSRNYLAKLLDQTRIVIVKGSKNKKSNNQCEEKFGFRGISEIDGLYMIKKIGKPNKKEYLALEVKTGEVNLDARHISSDIINPLQEIYGCKVHYMIVGFKEFLYENTNVNTLNNRLKQLYLDLKTFGIRPIVTHFPENRQFIDSLTDKIISQKSGIHKGQYEFDSNNNKISLNIGNQTLTGTFIPD